MPYYNDTHTVQWWTPGMFQLHKEKRVVLKFHSYHFKREICCVKLSRLHCLLVCKRICFCCCFCFSAADSSCCTETSAAAVSFERMRIRKHLRSHIRRKTGKHKDVIRITNHSWQLVDVHRWWFQVTDRKSDFVWKLYRHPEQSQALPSNTACWMFGQSSSLCWTMQVTCVINNGAEARKRWFHSENINASRQWRFELWSVRNVQNCHILFIKNIYKTCQKSSCFSWPLPSRYVKWRQWKLHWLSKGLQSTCWCWR